MAGIGFAVFLVGFAVFLLGLGVAFAVGAVQRSRDKHYTHWREEEIASDVIGAFIFISFGIGGLCGSITAIRDIFFSG